MNSEIYGRMIHEFPFVAAIARGNKLTIESIKELTVKKVDINLLTVKQGDDDINSGVFGKVKIGRQFYIVVCGGTSFLPKPVPRKVTIGSMLLALDTDAYYIVEIRRESWNDETPETSFVIYKMETFDWRKYAEADVI